MRIQFLPLHGIAFLSCLFIFTGVSAQQVVKEYHDNGRVRAEGALTGNGKKDGAWTEYYATGQKSSEGSYTDGQRSGAWTEWYPNGQVRLKADYSAGTIELFYENGKTESKGGVRNGTRQDRKSVV